MGDWTVYHKPVYDKEREQWLVRVTEADMETVINRIWCDTEHEANEVYEEKVSSYVSMFSG